MAGAKDGRFSKNKSLLTIVSIGLDNSPVSLRTGIQQAPHQCQPSCSHSGRYAKLQLQLSLPQQHALRRACLLVEHGNSAPHNPPSYTTPDVPLL
jgi:hypothetical protein